MFIVFQWNLIRLGGPAHGIVTNTVHKTLARDDIDQGDRGGRMGKGWRV